MAPPAPYTPSPVSAVPRPAGPAHQLANLPDNSDAVNNWLSGLSSEDRPQFDDLARRTQMPPEVLVRALTAHGAVRQRFGEELGPQGTGPGGDALQGFVAQMPESHQGALRDLQAWQLTDEGRPARRGPGAWVTRPFADAPQAGPNQLLEPHHYENLPELASNFDVDMRSPGFRTWWRNQQQAWGDQNTRPVGGVASLPGLYARTRLGQQHARESATQARDSANPGSTANMQELLRARQTGPLGIGDHIQGISRSALASRPWLVAGAAARDIADGRFNHLSMLGRDFMDYPNRLMGTDIGGNVESRPAAFRPGGQYANVPIGPDAGRGFFGTQVNPHTGAQSPGALGAFGQAFQQQALEPNTNALSRPLYTAGSHVADNLEAYLGVRNASRLSGSPAARFLQQGNNIGLVAPAVAAPVRALPAGNGMSVGNRVDDAVAGLRERAARPETGMASRFGQHLLANLGEQVPGTAALGGVGLAGLRARGALGRPFAAARSLANPLYSLIGAAPFAANDAYTHTTLTPQARQALTQDVGQPAEERRRRDALAYWEAQEENQLRATGRPDPAIHSRIKRLTYGDGR